MALYREGSEDIYDRELEDEVARCSTPFIWRNGKGQGSANVDRLRILSLIFTMFAELWKGGELLSGTEEDLMKVNLNSDDFAFLPGLERYQWVINNESLSMSY